eukprot:COSAG02_NODE_21286_length_794_cov_2.341007_1_plen_204_part_10
MPWSTLLQRFFPPKWPGTSRDGSQKISCVGSPGSQKKHRRKIRKFIRFRIQTQKSRRCGRRTADGIGAGAPNTRTPDGPGAVASPVSPRRTRCCGSSAMRLYCTQRCPYLGAQVAGVPFLEVPFLGVSLLGSGHQARLGTVNTRHYAASQLPAGNSGRLRNVRLSLHPWVSAAERSDTTAVDPAALASPHKPVQLSMYRPRTRR